METTIVILSTADFHAAVWTNKQHLATRLATSNEVIYVESLGLRRPRINASDFKRALKRVRRGRSRQDDNSRGVAIISPSVVPLHNLGAVRTLNGAMFRRQIRAVLRQRPGRTVLWTFSPVTYGVEEYFDQVVYHSVDLLHEVPGVDRAFLLAEERRLISFVDRVIASSLEVKQHLVMAGAQDVLLWENVADTDVYADQRGVKRSPAAVFAGNLTPSKVDFGLIQDVARQGIPVHLAGPCGIDGSKENDQIEELLRTDGVKYHGNLSPEKLALLLNSCTVGLIPYKINPYTRGVFPMKVYEYMAAGLAVVSTPLPSLEKVHDVDINVVAPETFVPAVVSAIDADEEAVCRRRLTASSHSWSRRAEDAQRLLRG